MLLYRMRGENNVRPDLSALMAKKIEIRMNLLNFLRTLETEEYLWIDPICIDQLDSEERNHQVRMMWNVYNRCDFACWSGYGMKLQTNYLRRLPSQS
jgi:hypothetical protein